MQAASNIAPNLPSNAKALRALVLAVMAERDAAVVERNEVSAERDVLAAQNELRVSAARSRRGSSVGRTRAVGERWSAMEISPRTRGGAGSDARLAEAT